MSREDDELIRAAANPYLSEDEAAALLARRDLPPQAIENIGNNPALANHRKILPMITAHPRTPKRLAIALARQMFTFELLRVVQTPGAPADVRRLCEDTILSRIESISTGERLTLAKSATGRIAAALLHDAEARIRETALRNPRLTEALIVRELMKPVPSELMDELQRDAKWSLRRDVRDAILRRIEQDAERSNEPANDAGDDGETDKERN